MATKPSLVLDSLIGGSDNEYDGSLDARFNITMVGNQSAEVKVSREVCDDEAGEPVYEEETFIVSIRRKPRLASGSITECTVIEGRTISGYPVRETQVRWS